MKRAQATLIAIYAKMDADAAAQQLSLLDDELAAAVLTQLTPKQSSAILNEIKPARASQLVGAMTSLPSSDTKAADGKKS
jgi:flagellar motility protein MotE (MotC chaperone)